MKAFINLLLPIVVAALALTACERRAQPGAEAESEGAHDADPGVSFSAKHGLLVPPASAAFIGLEIADVAERKVAADLAFSAQVYHAPNDPQSASIEDGAMTTALASGSVSASQAARLHGGQSVTTRRVEGEALPGRITAMNHALEKANGQVEILIAVDDARASLSKGAFVSVTVKLGGEKNVLSIPYFALLRTTEGDFVYTVSGEHFVRTPVQLGICNHEFAEVTEGLYEGDKIVIRPVMTLWLAELQSLRGGKSCADGH